MTMGGAKTMKPCRRWAEKRMESRIQRQIRHGRKNRVSWHLRHSNRLLLSASWFKDKRKELDRAMAKDCIAPCILLIVFISSCHLTEEGNKLQTHKKNLWMHHDPKNCCDGVFAVRAVRRYLTRSLAINVYLEVIASEGRLVGISGVPLLLSHSRHFSWTH